MTHSIPDKFEDLSPTQVEEFARFGFDVFCSVRNSILHSADFNSRCQKITEQQQELIKTINSSVDNMGKVKKTLIIDQDKWQFLEPLLGQYVVDEQAATLFDSNIDFDQIKKLPQGTRIVNILNDGYWGSTYTHTDTDHNGKPKYCVRKVSELKRIAMPEYMQHRNAGKLNWEILKQYIDTL